MAVFENVSRKVKGRKKHGAVNETLRLDIGGLLNLDPSHPPAKNLDGQIDVVLCAICGQGFSEYAWFSVSRQ